MLPSSCARCCLPLAVAMGAAVALACGAARPAPGDGAAASTLVQDVANEGDLEGTITAFERRLGRMAPTDPLYPQTLERLALAYVEHADALRAEAAAADNAPFRAALGQQAAERDARALERLEALVADFSSYEGTPSSLLLLAYAYAAQGLVDARAATLQRLVDDYAGTSWAADALVLQADDRFEEADWAGAATRYQQAIDAEPGAARAVHALHRTAWCRYRQGDDQGAFEAVKQAVQHPAAEESGLDATSRRDLVVFYAAIAEDAAGAATVLGPFARDKEELAAMLGLFNEAFARR